jgi:hypothetical protein
MGNTVNQAVLMGTLVSASSRHLVNLEFSVAMSISHTTPLGSMPQRRGGAT